MSSHDDPAEISDTQSPDAHPSSSHPSSSPSPPSSSSSPLILYSPPTFWGLLRGAAINLFLPFLNGLMLGFGELLAHEGAFRLGWAQTRVSVCSGAVDEQRFSDAAAEEMVRSGVKTED